MTIQPSFSFGGRRKLSIEGDHRPVDLHTEETVADNEKTTYPAPVRTASITSTASSEKQTFGVAKVEAITSVWTKKSLITLYALYFPA